MFLLNRAKVVTHGADSIQVVVAGLRQILQCVHDQLVLKTLVLTLLAQQAARDPLGFCHCPILQLKQLSSIVAVFVGFGASDELCQETEARFLLQTGKLAVIVD